MLDPLKMTPFFYTLYMYFMINRHSALGPNIYTLSSVHARKLWRDFMVVPAVPLPSSLIENALSRLFERVCLYAPDPVVEWIQMSSWINLKRISTPHKQPVALMKHAYLFERLVLMCSFKANYYYYYCFLYSTFCDRLLCMTIKQQ